MFVFSCDPAEPLHPKSLQRTPPVLELSDSAIRNSGEAQAVGRSIIESMSIDSACPPTRKRVFVPGIVNLKRSECQLIIRLKSRCWHEQAKAALSKLSVGRLLPRVLESFHNSGRGVKNNISGRRSSQGAGMNNLLESSRCRSPAAGAKSAGQRLRNVD